jgi:hypothetical protein
MKRMSVPLVCMVAAVTALCAASLLGGCGNDSKILEIKASSSVDNTTHAVTIDHSEVIYGNALPWIVLTYPDGHSQLVTSGDFSGAGSGITTLDGLPSGNPGLAPQESPAKGRSYAVLRSLPSPLRHRGRGVLAMSRLRE